MKKNLIISLYIFCFVAGYFLNTIANFLFTNPSIVAIKIKTSPTSGTTFFIVDSYGAPVPNARLAIESLSGFTYSLTNEFGYSEHEIGEDSIITIKVNDKLIYEGNFYLHYTNIGQCLFLIKLSDD